MNCQEVLGAVNEYVDGETHSALCQALRQHLAGCDSCRVIIDNLRQTIKLYRAGEETLFPNGLHEKLLSIMRDRWANTTAGSTVAPVPPLDDAAYRSHH